MLIFHFRNVVSFASLWYHHPNHHHALYRLNYTLTRVLKINLIIVYFSYTWDQKSLLNMKAGLVLAEAEVSYGPLFSCLLLPSQKSSSCTTLWLAKVWNSHLHLIRISEKEEACDYCKTFSCLQVNFCEANVH